MKTQSTPPAVLVLTSDDYIYGMRNGYYEENHDLYDAGKIDFINTKKARSLEKKGKITNITNCYGEIFLYEPYSQVYLPETSEDTYSKFLLEKAFKAQKVLKLMGAHYIRLSDEISNENSSSYNFDLTADITSKPINNILDKLSGANNQLQEVEKEKKDKEEKEKKKDTEEKEENANAGLGFKYEKKFKAQIKQVINDFDPTNKPKSIEFVNQEMLKTGQINDSVLKNVFEEFRDNGGKLNCMKRLDIEMTTELNNVSSTN